MKTRMKKQRWLYALVGVTIVAGLMAGCGKKEPAEIVRQRSTERWNLITTQQLAKAYEYLSPGYRETHTLEQYIAFIATAKMQWKGATVDSLQCDEDVCTVKLTVTTLVPGQLTRTPTDVELGVPVVEKWVSSSGKWYFLPDSRVKPAEMLKDGGDQKAAPFPAPENATVPGRPAGS